MQLFGRAFSICIENGIFYILYFITDTMDFGPFHNDESLCRRRRGVKNRLNDESFTAHFPFYPDTQTFTLGGVHLEMIYKKRIKEKRYFILT